MKQFFQNKILIIVWMAITLLSWHPSRASHSMGADLTYTCLGGNTYRITLSFYRDCIGIPAPTHPFITINSASCGQSLGVTCNPRPGTGMEVTPACSSTVTTCHGGSFTGIQEWIYDGIVTLPMQCTDWKFGYSLCCRNAAITNISNPSSSTFYIYATLNNQITPCNSSPTFSNKPVPFICIGQQFCFNHGAYDADGDSLAYSLITPMQTSSSTVNYNAPYNAANPLNSAPATTFNPLTGDICLTPQALEVTVMAVLVKEYRNGVLIGTVERDLQLTVMNCNNNLPWLTGINGTNIFTTTICANQQTCFNILSNDPDTGQHLTVTWDNSIPGATFNATSALHPVSTFCWTPGPSDIGHTYTFTVRVADDACPYFGSQIFSYSITVIGMTVNAGPDQNIACSDQATLTATGAGGTGTYTYLWNTGSTMQSITVGAGTYWVTASDGLCSATDTVVVSMPFLPVAGFNYTPVNCVNNPVQFTDQSTTPAGVLSSWFWDFGDSATSTSQNPVHQYAASGTYNVSLIVSNSLGCWDTTMQQITILPLPVSAFTFSNGCVNNGVTFTDQTLPAATSWQWDFGDGTTSVVQNPTHSYVSAGTFLVTLISGGVAGCTDNTSQSITIYPLPVVNAGSDQTVCAGGSVTLSASGGITYTWNPGGSTGASVIVTPGSTTNYIVFGNSPDGCVSSDTVTVIVNPLPNVSAGPDKAICNGDAATLTATGAISFLWLPVGDPSPTIVVDPAITTTYSVVGTDALGCTNTDQVDVVVHQLPVANAGPDVNVCNGSSVTLIASGGTFYHWNPSGDTTSTATVSPVVNTTYSVLVTDGYGCSQVDFVNVTVLATPVVHLGSVFLCAGAEATLDAGIAGDSYLWSPTGETTQAIFISSGGVYSVRVTDPNGCSATSSLTVNSGASITINLGNTSFCQGDSVQLDAGYPGMTYNWNPSGETTQKIWVKTAGTFGVIVTDTNGCSGSIAVNVMMNPLPNPNFNASSACLNNATVFTDASSVSSGSVTGWSWIFGDLAVSLQQNPLHTYAASGTYTVTLTTTSQAGCTRTISHPVTVNPLPVADFAFSNACQNDPINFTNLSAVSTGNIVTYSWSFGDGTNSTLQNPAHQFAAPGNYNVSLTVTTAGGCQGSIVHQLTVHPKPVADFSAPAVCFGSTTVFLNNSSISTGSISSFFWDFNDSYTSNQTSPSHVYNTAATFNVSLLITSALGCMDTATVPVTVYNLPTASAGPDQTICTGMQVSLAAAGGVAYAWAPGGQNAQAITVSPTTTSTYSVTVTDVHGCTANDAVTILVNPLPTITAGADKNICIGAGVTLSASGGVSYSWNPGFLSGSSVFVQPTTTTDYLVSATDFNGCENFDTVRVIVNALPVINAGPDQSICAGSTISLSGSGGNTYLWNPVGSASQTVLVTPAATSSYILIGTDVNGCVNSDTVQITVHSVPVVNMFPAFVCPGYMTTLDAGNTGSTYLWSTGDDTQTLGVSTAGTYSVLVTNPYGCSVLGNTTVTVGGTISGTPINTAICYGQVATLNAGNPGSTFLWSTGATTQVITTATAGNYTVRITDNNGCSASFLNTVQVNPLPAVAFSAPADCFGSAIQFTDFTTIPAGSVSAYNWSFGDGNNSSSQNTTHAYAAPGTYSVTLTTTSTGGCTSSLTHTVRVYDLPQADFNIPGACLGSPSVFSDLSTIASGNIASWSWTFGDNNSSSSQNPWHIYAAAGNHTASLVITSDHGCKDTVTKNLLVYGLPTASFGGAASCAQSGVQFSNTSYSLNGSITASAWSFGDGGTSAIFFPTHAFANEGTYPVQLIVTSVYGCQDTAQSSITIHPLPVSDFTISPACAGTAVSIANHSTVVTGSLTNYYWNFGDNSTAGTVNPYHAFASDGTYYITLVSTSNFGCRDTVLRPVVVYPLPVPSFIASDVCVGNEVEFIDATTLSSGSITGWSWSFGDQSNSSLPGPVHIYSGNGTFPVQLTVTSNQGCTAVYSKNINIFPNPVASFVTNNVCFGSPNLFVNQSSVNGGVAFTSHWDFSDGVTDSLSNPDHTFQSGGNFNVALTITTANGCMDQLVESISVYMGPVTRFSANDNCFGQQTQFNDNSTAVDGSIESWLWRFGDGITSTESNPVHTYSNAGRYRVSLTTTTTFGCNAGYVDSLEIFARPASTIQAQNVCFGSPVQFTNTSFNPTLNNVSYQWDLGNGVSMTDSSFLYAYGSPGNYTVSLQATSTVGCTNAATYHLSVFPVPAVQFATDGSCLHAATQFNNQSSISSGTVAGWSWDFGDGQVTNQQAPVHMYQSLGTYPVTLTAVSDQGCSGNSSATVRINPTPVVSFGSGAQGCAPLSAAFQDNSVVSSGNIVGWLWNFGDGGVSTDQHPDYVFHQGGQYDVTLTVVSDNGCTASLTAPNIVRVFAQPIADFNADPMVTDILAPTVHFQNTSQGYTSYQWTFGDGQFTSTESNPTHTFRDTGTYTAQLITVNSYGCRDTILKVIEVLPHSTLYVPNCFTPNGDGRNDVFRPYFTQMKDIQVWIFDRWGKLLTSWDGLEGSWDGYYGGQKCQSDVYVYKIKGLGLDGKYSEWVGHVSIVY